MSRATTLPVLTATPTGATGTSHLVWTPPLWDTEAFPSYVVIDYAMWYTLTDPPPAVEPFPAINWHLIAAHGTVSVPGAIPGTATDYFVNTGVNAITHYVIDAALGALDAPADLDTRNYSNVASATPYTASVPVLAGVRLAPQELS